ncbi:predicted protein [Histoplasma mississippiense (nom. inval.)]|uniref:predicted protein n=1 Tax=Ajellomyces capsulatus (strain NAm1 / WU24) TaxID=2059318 RepID=UPI000157BCD5|nr:predicted protein [Histoplasma mississippiense (nom. inval.)]EDN06119.1 predicted protein [Histoplasma mississippiense (nom. inval.)]
MAGSKGLDLTSGIVTIHIVNCTHIDKLTQHAILNNFAMANWNACVNPGKTDVLPFESRSPQFVSCYIAIPNKPDRKT